MAISLGKVFGLTLDESAAKAAVASAAAATVGRAASQVLLGWIPGVGNIINATTAATLTETIGWIVAKEFERQSVCYGGTIMFFLLPAVAAIVESAAVATGGIIASTGTIGAAIAAGTTSMGGAVGATAAGAAAAIGAETATVTAVGTLAAGGTTTALNVGVIETAIGIVDD